MDDAYRREEFAGLRLQLEVLTRCVEALVQQRSATPSAPLDESNIYVVFYDEAAENEVEYADAIYDEPVYDEVVYEEAVYDEAEYAEAIYDEAVYDDIVYAENVYDEPMYDEPVYDKAEYAEAVYDEPVYSENVYDEPRYDKPVYYETEYEGVGYDEKNLALSKVIDVAVPSKSIEMNSCLNPTERITIFSLSREVIETIPLSVANQRPPRASLLYWIDEDTKKIEVNSMLIPNKKPPDKPPV